MNKRVYGALGISAIMSNWNADFSGYPKTTSEGQVFGSDKALKYPMKKMWEEQGEKVLYIKSMKFQEEQKVLTLIPRTLKERYEQIFKESDLKKVDAKTVMTNLFQAIDVKNFGATFAVENKNLAITGAVQIGQGFNKYEESQAFEQQILSPFKDPKAKDKSAKKGEEGEEAKNSTLGTKIVSDEAHYLYSFTINPMAYDNWVKEDVTEGYTEEDYKKFKQVALTAATSFATNAKSGCENELGLFVETEPDLYLPNLAEYITFQKEDDKNVFSLKCSDLFNELRSKIKSIEIYFNPYTSRIDHDIEDVKLYNIFTQSRI